MTKGAVALALAGAVGTVAAQEPGGPHLELPQVIEQGNAGPHLLLIPCAGCGAPSWRRFMEVNADRFRMVAVTLPGYDGSPRPELPLWGDRPVFQDNALERLSELLDGRGLTRVVVVGQSFGATMALRLAALRPDVVQAVVGVDASPTSPLTRANQSGAERLAEAREVVDEDYALRLQDPEEYRRFNAARTLPDEESRLLHHGMFMASDRVAMLHYWRENILQDLNSAFRELTVPYLDVDAIGPRSANPDSVAAAYEAAIQAVGPPEGYRLVRFWQTSHWVHVERPGALGRTIEDFLAGREVQDVGPAPGRDDEAQAAGMDPSPAESPLANIAERRAECGAPRPEATHSRTASR